MMKEEVVGKKECFWVLGRPNHLRKLPTRTWRESERTFSIKPWDNNNNFNNKDVKIRKVPAMIRTSQHPKTFLLPHHLLLHHPHHSPLILKTFHPQTNHVVL